MAQKLIQSQEQKLQQVQKLSQQQMLQVRLLEMPLAELEENINAEIDDNPALEALPRHVSERRTRYETYGKTTQGCMKTKATSY